MKQTYKYDFDNPDSFFRIDNQNPSASGDYIRYQYGNEEGDILEVDVTTFMGDIKNIDCLICENPIEMHLELPDEKTLSKAKIFVYSPAFTNEDGSEYDNSFRILFNREELIMLFTPSPEKAVRFYKEDRMEYYLNRKDEVLCVKVCDLTEQEYEAIKNKKKINNPNIEIEKSR